ncbi:MAG: hypothetical protein RLZZ301_1231 [Bacteroidota bacterium]
MKRLVVFSIRAFAGPFLITLTIAIFILILQFFWVYIDDLMGKGLSVWLILELLFYVSASIIPLALPLSILLSSLMTFGNMSENNELTALKSSGLSLVRIMRPLSMVVVCIAIGTFFFYNYVIPAANLKWHTLIYDIQNKKISAILTPGVYSTYFEGFAIKVDTLDGKTYKGITINDYSHPSQLRTVRAKSAKIYKSINGRFLFLDLHEGRILEEMDIQNPMYLPNGQLSTPSKRPSRISTFEQGTYKLNLNGLELNRSKEDLFTDKYEMLNVFQIHTALDSLQQQKAKLKHTFATNSVNEYLSLHAKAPKARIQMAATDPSLQTHVEVPVLGVRQLPTAQVQNARNLAISRVRRNQQQLESQQQYFTTLDRENDLYWIEFHRKFALSYSILVLFFVGAPLGAIIRKGGFGAPAVAAILIFLFYFILITIGDNLADTGSLSPLVGMWMAAWVFTPVAIFITRSALLDRQVFQTNFLLRMRQFIRKKDA